MFYGLWMDGLRLNGVGFLRWFYRIRASRGGVGQIVMGVYVGCSEVGPSELCV